MTRYLFTYYVDEHFCVLLADMEQIARTVGCRDCNETSNHKVYRVLPDGVTQLVIGDHHRDLTICLYDRFDNLIDSAKYPDH